MTEAIFFDGTGALYPQLELEGAEKFYEDNEMYAVDNAAKSFYTNEEMLDFLAVREKNADWVTVDTNSISIGCVENMADFDIADLPTVLSDTVKNTGLFLIGSEVGETPLRDCAIPTLQDRAGISGRALEAIQREVYVEHMNMYLSVAQKKAITRLRIADGKVSAAMSSDYVPLSMPALFSEAVTYLNERFPNCTYIIGEWNHTLISCEWMMPGETALITKYREALLKHGIRKGALVPVLRMTSSDVGISAVNLLPKLLVGEGKRAVLIPLGSPTGLHHKGAASIEKFIEHLSGVFALYGKRLTELSSLLEYEVQYPSACMARILKRCGISKKYAAETIDFFMATMRDTCTAHDVFHALGHALYLLLIDGVTGIAMLRHEENVARALTFNYAEYDFPSDSDK